MYYSKTHATAKNEEEVFQANSSRCPSPKKRKDVTDSQKKDKVSPLLDEQWCKEFLNTVVSINVIFMVNERKRIEKQKEMRKKEVENLILHLLYEQRNSQLEEMRQAREMENERKKQQEIKDKLVEKDMKRRELQERRLQQEKEREAKEEERRQIAEEKLAQSIERQKEEQERRKKETEEEAFLY